MVAHAPPDATVPGMFYNWFDHPLIEGWREARLRAELHNQGRPRPSFGLTPLLIFRQVSG